jgi:hypothetical protein
MSTPSSTLATLRLDTSLSAYGTARSTIEGTPLSPEGLRKVNVY